MQRIRILVAEDATLVRRLLTEQLARDVEFEVVGEAADGREAVDLALSLRPDVVVMDLSMPGLNGAEATARIASAAPSIQVIFLTVHKELMSMGTLSGAAATLSKDCTPQELSGVIRRVHTSRRPRGVVDNGDAADRRAIEYLAIAAGLTRREKTLLERLVSSEATNQQLSSALSAELGEKMSLSAVKHSIARIMSKLHVEPRTRSALVKRVLEVWRTRQIGSGSSARDGGD